MFRSLRNAVLALAAIASIGTAALVTTSSQADARGFHATSFRGHTARHTSFRGHHTAFRGHHMHRHHSHFRHHHFHRHHTHFRHHHWHHRHWHHRHYTFRRWYSPSY